MTNFLTTHPIIYHALVMLCLFLAFRIGMFHKEWLIKKEQKKQLRYWQEQQPKAYTVKPKKRRLFGLMATVLFISIYANAQSGLLIGMGAGYANKTIYGELVAGYKSQRTGVYYNQVALLSSSQPAYFGIAGCYDVVSNGSYRITAAAGYYFRKFSSDVKGRQGGNYYTPGVQVSYNKEYFTVTVRYIDGSVQAGILFSGLISNSHR